MMTLIKDLLNKATLDEGGRQKAKLHALDYLTTIWSSQDTNIDIQIKQHNRDYPRGIDGAWRDHLIGLSQHLLPKLGPHPQALFEIERPVATELPGIKLFDQLRAPSTSVRSLDSFQEAFRAFCGFELRGLDWANIFIAGGSVLAAVTATETEDFFKRLRSSDVDIFLYGLDGHQALGKLCHITEVLRANIPAFDQTYVVERSVGAITFAPGLGSEGRKVQVVLRLSANPAAILAGFDFDQVSLGYDGSEVWLSPRAVRALYTGYTVTSGAISSSFAARIIKYACRGYGLIILPDYGRGKLERLHKRLDEEERLVRDYWTSLPWHHMSNFSHLYTAMKHRSDALWTHSFSSLATLVALWKVAHSACRIGELLYEVGTSHSLCGGYEASDVLGAHFGIDEWSEVLVELIPSLSGTKGLPTTDVWKIRAEKMTRTVFRQRISMVVILPLRMRAFLISAAPSVCGGDKLVLLRGGSGLTDSDGIKLEVCLWHVDGSNMWQPSRGLPAQVHQFLMRATMITAWTIWKVAAGAPWLKMHYSRSLAQSQRHSANAAIADKLTCNIWLRE
ncbi:hypothetical protein CF326_g2218 [Tilletia indica]|nr:hypothetical protein CF326_g2218 [Tilletia indica]